MSNRLLFTVLVVLVFIGAGPLVSAVPEETGSVSGLVYEKDSKTPLAGVQFVLQRVERTDEGDIVFKEKYETNTTDGSGQYSRENLPVGEYLVHIRLNGKMLKTRRVDFFIRIYEDRDIEFSFPIKA